mgnify:CR=1 FL=1|tara:strand:+ start:119 stop:1516 length:1398 start_codon:yes stop_codon:yes gene_type:complete
MIYFQKKLPDPIHYHFIGIGGIGMSGIAEVLMSMQFSVSGSDLLSNVQTKKLYIKGATIFNNQNSRNIDTILKKYPTKKIIVVISSAIKKNNIELNYCIQKKITIRHRSEILSMIMNSYQSIGVAGTHGKTSTSTFLFTLLDLCTSNVSAIIGGVLPQYENNYFIKATKYFVSELDESDGSISNYKADLGIINNIDYDHCDYYKNIEQMISSFKIFESNSKKLLVNNDCEIIRKHIQSDYKWSITNIDDINYSLIPIDQTSTSTIAQYFENGKLINKLEIPIPGLHNLSNIAASIAACRINNIDFNKIKAKISELQLPHKRFEFKGDIAGRTIFDDYAHHPQEIKATIKLGRLFLNENHKHTRLIAIFQPHRFSRVNKFLVEFANELALADQIIITNIYGAGEKNINNISSSTIAEEIYKTNKNVKTVKDNYEIRKNFNLLTQENDLIINMGAGDCHNLWQILKS